MPRLILAQRNRVLRLLNSDVLQIEVGGRFYVAESTVSRSGRRVNDIGTHTDRLRPCQLRVTTVRQDNCIRERHSRNRFVTAQSTANAIVGNRRQPMNRETVINRLREHGVRCRPLMSGSHPTSSPLEAELKRTSTQTLFIKKTLWTHKHTCSIFFLICITLEIGIEPCPDSMSIKHMADEYSNELAQKLEKYEVLRDLDLFVLDNSIRESTVGQLRGHTCDDKWQIYDEVTTCGFSDLIVASFSDHVTVDEDFLQELVLNGVDKSGLYVFSDITTCITNGVPETKHLPKGLKLLRRFGLQNVILELDLGDSAMDFRQFTIDGVCNLLLKLVTWCHENLHEKSIILVNFRDMPTAMRDNPSRVFKIVTFLARLPTKLFGLLYEDPNGECMPDEFAAWAKFIRKIMDDNNWKGHLLVHAHEKFCLADFTILEALLHGADGIWAGVSREGAQVGHASSIVTLINLIRLGNKKVLQRYNCTYLRRAAIAVTRITTGKDPPDHHPIYGARALDFVLNLDEDQCHLANLFCENAPARISSVCTEEMIIKRLADLFGPDKQFTTEIASLMKQQMLQDAREYRKEKYMSKHSLAILFIRVGGKLTQPMREELTRHMTLTPQAERLLRKARKKWNSQSAKSGDKFLSDTISYDAFYKCFMSPYFPNQRCLGSRKVFQVLDFDKNGSINWSNFQIFLIWSLGQLPETDSIDDVIERVFRVGIKNTTGSDSLVKKTPKEAQRHGENKFPEIKKSSPVSRPSYKERLPKTKFLPTIKP